MNRTFETNEHFGFQREWLKLDQPLGMRHRTCYFGGDDGGDIQQASTLTAEQSELLKAISSGLTPLVGSALTPQGAMEYASVTDYQNQALSGLGGLQGLGTQGIDIAQQALSGIDPTMAQSFLAQSQDALTEGLQGFDPDRIMEALEPGRQLALKTFERDVVPSLLERFGATSGQSGGLNRSLAEAGGDLALGLGAQAAPYLGQAALQAPGLQMQGASLAGNLSQLPGQLSSQALGIGAAGSDILGQLLNAGSIQRGFEQEPLTAQYQANQQPSQILSSFAPLALGTQAFTNYQQQQSPSLMSSLMPALGTGAGAYAGSASGSAAITSGLSGLAALI